MEEMVGAQRAAHGGRFQSIQPGLRPMDATDRDRAVERDDR